MVGRGDGRRWCGLRWKIALDASILEEKER
jgi:hypothetical protein